jgi:hypothetical protein
MRLTTYTDYTLRTLIYLALHPDRLATIATIAEGYGISENHLMKVAHQLGLAGYVETAGGRTGACAWRNCPRISTSAKSWAGWSRTWKSSPASEIRVYVLFSRVACSKAHWRKPLTPLPPSSIGTRSPISSHREPNSLACLTILGHATAKCGRVC